MDIFGTLVGALGNLAENVINWFSTKKTNETNKEINQQNLDFQASQTQAQWERDDTSHQREVADLKAAGLSPLANVAGNNNTQALSAPSTIAMQAPQISANSLINAALEDKALNETERHNRVQEGQKYTELNQKSQELQNKLRELSIKDKEIENTFVYQCKYLGYLEDQLNEVNRHNESEESLKRLSIRSEEYFKSIQSQTNGNSNYEVYTDVTKYQAALSAWSTEFEGFINNFIAETSSSSSSSYSNGYSGSTGVNSPIVGASGSVGSNESSSGSHSYNVSQKQQAEIDRWYKSHPMPVYIYHVSEN